MQIRLVFRNKFFGEKAVENRLMFWNNERCQRFLKKMVFLQLYREENQKLSISTFFSFWRRGIPFFSIIIYRQNSIIKWKLIKTVNGDINFLMLIILSHYCIISCRFYRYREIIVIIPWKTGHERLFSLFDILISSCVILLNKLS